MQPSGRSAGAPANEGSTFKLWHAKAVYKTHKGYRTHKLTTYVHHVMGVCCIVFDIDGMWFEFLAPLCHLAAELFKCRLVHRRRRRRRQL